MNKHTKPFRCSVLPCGRSFARNCDRQRHEDSVHKRQGRFFCSVPECDRSTVGFPRKDHLEQHMRNIHKKRTLLTVAESQGSGFPSSRLDQERSEVSPPRKRMRRVDEQSQAAQLLQPDPGTDTVSDLELLRQKLQELEEENQSLREHLSEVKKENKSQKDQLEKQTETIHMLVTGKR
jgi:hypothetical protein